MRKRWIGYLAVVMLGLPASGDAGADAPRPGKGFWKILVKPKAKWVLHDSIGDSAERKAARVTVETYDVRKVDGADVARLRWTHSFGKEKEDIGGGQLKPTQVAVTSAGIYLLSATMDDAKIAAALKNKPARSDPPKAYRGTKLNKGRYLRTDDGIVCMGEEPLEGDGDCADVCEAEVCISPTEGVVSMMGLAAPGYSMWSR